MEHDYSPCGSGYSLIGDICEPTPKGYVETRSRCEMRVDSREAAGVEQDYAAERAKCRNDNPLDGGNGAEELAIGISAAASDGRSAADGLDLFEFLLGLPGSYWSRSCLHLESSASGSFCTRSGSGWYPAL